MKALQRKARPSATAPKAGTAILDVADGGGPLYRRLKLELVNTLISERYAAGDLIPTESQLAATYGVSVGTVRKAVDELVAEHILVRQQGRGTFIARHSDAATASVFWRVVHSDGSQQLPLVQTLDFARGKADARIAKALDLETGDAIWIFDLLLFLGGRPVSVERVTVPRALFPDLNQAAISNRDRTNYALYQEAFGITVISVSDMIAAIEADPAAAKLLRIAPGTPILEIMRTAFAIGNRPVEIRRSLILTNDYRYISQPVERKP